MSQSARRRIFLSSFPPRGKRYQEFAQTYDLLLESLSVQDCEFVSLTEFKGYPLIAETIETCDALLYVMDDGWKGSTQKAFEVFYALGREPRMVNDQLIFISQTVPVFLRPVPYDLDLGAYGGVTGITLLPEDASEAARVISRRLQA